MPQLIRWRTSTEFIFSRIILLICCLFILSSPCYADLTSGLVAYYPFDGNALDASGNGHDGTIHGSTLTTDRLGNANSAYSFDGVDDYIDMGSFPFVYDYSSVSLWIKTGKGINNYGFFDWNNSYNDGGFSTAIGAVYDGHPSDLLKIAFRDDLWIDGKYPYCITKV